MKSAKWIKLVTVVALGLFSGAMLLIAFSLIPFWKNLPPDSYRDSFKAMGPFLGSTMIPLMLTSIVLTGTCIFVEKRGRAGAFLAFLLVVTIIPLYGLIHGPINEAILGSDPLPPEVLATLRDKWALWHWVRTGLGLTSQVTLLNSFPKN